MHRARALADLGAATRIRAPCAVSASDAFEASFTSPLPVKPEPWKNSDEADAAVGARRSAVALAAVSRCASPPSRSTCERAAVVAERLAGRGRVAGPERVRSRGAAPDRCPSASAMRSMCTSTANCVCGAPKPRNAPLGGVFVIIARAADADVVAAVRARPRGSRRATAPPALSVA